MHSFTRKSLDVCQGRACLTNRSVKLISIAHWQLCITLWFKSQPLIKRLVTSITDPKHALHYFSKAIESDRRGSRIQRISRPLDKRWWTIDRVHVMKPKINYNPNKCFNDNPSKFGSAWIQLKQVPAVALESSKRRELESKFHNLQVNWQSKDPSYGLEYAIQMQMDFKTSKAINFDSCLKIRLKCTLWVGFFNWVCWSSLCWGSFLLNLQAFAGSSWNLYKFAWIYANFDKVP